MNDELLDKLERLAKAATPVPWKDAGIGRIRAANKRQEFVADCAPIVIYRNKTLIKSMANSAYILAACNAVPSLIARVRELERQRNKLLGMYCNEMVCSWCWLDAVCPHFDETIVRRNPNSEGCRETLRKWLEEAAKEAGE